MNKYIQEPKGKHYTPQSSLYLQCWCVKCILDLYNGMSIYDVNDNVHTRWVSTECPDCGKFVCARVYNHTDMCGIKVFETQ